MLITYIPAPAASPIAETNPQACRRGKPAHGNAFMHNRAGTQKADAAYYLRRNTCRVPVIGIGYAAHVSVIKAIHGNQHYKCRTGADKYMGSEPGRAVAAAAFYTYSAS